MSFSCRLELVKKFVWWVGGWVGGWVVVCKAILVFYFGPNQDFGLGLRLGPSRTTTTTARTRTRTTRTLTQLLLEGIVLSL